MISQQQFANLLEGFLWLTEVMHEEKIPLGSAWMNDAQILAIKCAKTALSVEHLASHTHRIPVSDGYAEFIDHSSIAVLSRSVLEACLAFHFTFCNQSSSVREFRHQMWVHSGLLERSKISPISEAGVKKIKSNAVFLAESRECLKANPLFQQLNPREQKNVISSGSWRPQYAWIDIAEDFGYPRRYFSNIYGLLCGHAHASYISVLQTRDAVYELETQRKLSQPMVEFCAVAVSKLAIKYADLFQKAGEELKRNAPLREAFSFWASLTDFISYPDTKAETN